MFSIYGFLPTGPMPYRKWSASVHPEDLSSREASLRKVIEQKGDGSAEFRITLPDGEVRSISATERAVLDRSGDVVRVIGVNVDVTERKQAEDVLRHSEAQMTHLAEHDFLTDLPNQMVLRDRIDQAIKLAARDKKNAALLFLDIDGFKHINDSLGHPAGDRLLQSIAKRLVDCVRASDTVSRLGGDEFIVLLPEVEKPEDTAITAGRMLEAIAATHSVGQHDLQITGCIGISCYPADGLDAETLIKNADTAMYQAKEHGNSCFRFFHQDMNVRAVERQFIEQNLRRALQRQELFLNYQPKINLKTGAITGVEALIRWMHPVRGLISPAQLIPVAEDCGLMLPIGTWVIREACRQARTWRDAGLPSLTMAVNVSGRQLQNDSFVEDIFSTLLETGMDPRSLELEITEGLLMRRPEFTASIFQTLRKRGVKIAIDDFGTGYSSLSYLHKFPVDTLKIDQSFVRQIAIPGQTSIVTAITSMGRSLGMRIIAEGVETERELAVLQDLQCDEAQGYYFSRPVSTEQVATLMAHPKLLPSINGAAD
jgi:diguanylate cyclase (GGDEF)-like protein